MAITAQNIIDAIQLQFMTALETVNTTDFTAVGGTPSFEAATAFPNSRTEKFLDFTGSEYYTFNASTNLSMEEGIFHCWIKPDFDQASATYRFIFDTYNSSTTDGFQFNFRPGIDDWRFNRISDGAGLSVDSVGETWSANDVIHMVVMWSNAKNLDNNKNLSLYINNILIASDDTNWTVDGSDVMAAVARLGAFWNSTAYNWDGGLFDAAFLDHTALALVGTDVEIVQSLYSNTLNSGTDHVFV